MARHPRGAFAAIASIVIAIAGPIEAAPAPGAALYAARCSTCHGASLTGSEEAPPLIGAELDRKWREHRPALVEKIRRSMPHDDPGTLTQAQARALADSILTANRAQRAR